MVQNTSIMTFAGGLILVLISASCSSKTDTRTTGNESTCRNCPLPGNVGGRSPGRPTAVAPPRPTSLTYLMFSII
jgi:hypothetical protein